MESADIRLRGRKMYLQTIALKALASFAQADNPCRGFGFLMKSGVITGNTDPVTIIDLFYVVNGTLVADKVEDAQNSSGLVWHSDRMSGGRIMDREWEKQASRLGKKNQGPYLARNRCIYSS